MKSIFLERLGALMTEHKADISVMEWDAVDRLLDVRKIRMVISFKEDEHTHDVILD